MEKRSGTYSRIYLHFIWSTRGRAEMLDDDIKRSVIGVFGSKATEMGFEILEANGVRDHIHILIKMPPKLPPSEIAKELKGASSHFVNHITLKNDPLRSLYWQDGYGVVSLSPSAIRSVREYIRTQAKHHRDKTLIEDFEKSSVD